MMIQALLLLLAVGCGDTTPPVSVDVVAPSDDELPQVVAVPDAEVPAVPEAPAADPVVEAKSKDLTYDLAGLEWYINDQDGHRKNCAQVAWDQPTLASYKAEPKSHLPAECKAAAE